MRVTTKKPARKSTPSKAKKPKAQKPSRSDRPPRDILITDTVILIRPSNDTPLLVSEGDIVTFHAPLSSVPVGRMTMNITPDSPPLFGEDNRKLHPNTEFRVAAGTRNKEYSWTLEVGEGQEPMQGKIVVNSGQGD